MAEKNIVKIHQQFRLFALKSKCNRKDKPLIKT